VDALTGPAWTPSPRLTYLAGGVLSLFAGLFFGIGAVAFHQARFYALPAVILLGASVPLLYGWWRTSRTYSAARRLRAEGLPGIATVLGVGQTGLTMRGHPLLALELEVQVEGRPPYRVRRREYVPRDRVDALAAGEALPVRVDPEDPSRLVVEWAR
jgi:hypothetical protein